MKVKLGILFVRFIGGSYSVIGVFIARMGLIACCVWGALAAATFAASAQEPGLASVLIPPLDAPEGNSEPTPLELFEAKLDQTAASDQFIGLAVAVVEKGETVLMRTYGVTEKDGRQPVTSQTVFPVASLSKGFAGALAAKLSQEGFFSLEDPVTEYAPHFRLKSQTHTRNVKLETVLSHQVGLPPYAYDNLLEAGQPIDEIVRRLREVDLVCGAGNCYSYQNVAFNLITPAIEKATGERYGQVLDDRIFSPLGMVTASVGSAQLRETKNYARGHVRVSRRRGYWRTSSIDENYYRVPAAGGVNASIEDMSRWLKAQMGLAPITMPPELLAEIHRPRIRSVTETARLRWLRRRVKDSHYGLGWRIYDYAGREVITHAGGVDGYRAHIAFLPEQELGIVALWNSTASRGWRIMPTLFDAYLGLEDPDWLELVDSE